MILVVRDGGTEFDPAHVEFPRLSSGEALDFLRLFPRSGVYRLPEREIVHDIDWFCLEHELLSSPDLKSFARVNRSGSGWALKFYSECKEMNTYTIDQLLTSFSHERFRPFTTADWHVRWHEDFKLEGDQLVVTTVDREIAGFPIGFFETHTFDLATGNLLNTEIHNERLRSLVSATFGCIAILIAFVFVYVRAKWNQTRAQSIR